MRSVNLTDLAPLPVDEWDPALAPVAASMNGAPLNVHKLMAHNPALLNAWWNFRNHAVNGGSLGPRRGELVILRVGVHLAAWYEWGSHLDRSLRCGLTLQEIRAVLQPETEADWHPAEAALLDAVDMLLRDHALSRAMQQRLDAHFSVAEVLDIIAIHGMYLTLGCMIRSWELALDAEVSARIAPHGSEAEFDAAARAFRDHMERQGRA
jgi:4-carboxymuconolactone decarboxylase